MENATGGQGAGGVAVVAHAASVPVAKDKANARAAKEDPETVKAAVAGFPEAGEEIGTRILVRKVVPAAVKVVAAVEAAAAEGEGR